MERESEWEMLRNDSRTSELALSTPMLPEVKQKPWYQGSYRELTWEKSQVTVVFITFVIMRVRCPHLCYHARPLWYGDSFV